MFLFTALDPSSRRLGTSIICVITIILCYILYKPIPLIGSVMFSRIKILTFKASSSKQCSTFCRVLALHSRNMHLSSFARAIPSSLLTPLSDSCNHICSSTQTIWMIEKKKKKKCNFDCRLTLSTLFPTSILTHSWFVE